MDSLKGFGARLRSLVDAALALPSSVPPRQGGEKPAGRALVRVALGYALLNFLLLLYFVVSRRLPPSPAALALLAALPLGLGFGLAAHFFSRWRSILARHLERVTPGYTTTFLLFFVHMIGYLLLFSGLVAFPLGVVIDGPEAASALVLEFRLYSVNFVLVMALLSWFVAEHRLIDGLLAVARRLLPKETP
ncbi:hypothetical protein ACHHRT_01465 [Desulfurivibrio sp. D14AmB]|uniref:hypothetical protein n=1 Tax=Desulfurivibrio sp. D14AmB TaxID=3374370 RepID=UPI00376EF0E1